MSTSTQHGYLVIADISGYTSFVAKTELEHSHEILTELLELLCAKFDTLMTISKLEGDAVFAYVDEARVNRGETLVEFMELMYVAFRDTQISMRRKTTCTCLACQNIPTLDLKFIAHHGDYIIQNVGNLRELVGSDVNLVHRLLKNHIAEATGWKAYMLLTQRCLDHLQLDIDNAHEQVESYEHLEDTKTYSLDLHKRYTEIVEARRVIIELDDANIILIADTKLPPHYAWEWAYDSAKRNLWTPDVVWSSGNRPNGRISSGASNHCAHGKGVSTEIFLDWRPFEYATADMYDNGKKLGRQTFRFEQLPNGGTRILRLMEFEMKIPRPLRKFVGKAMAKMMKEDAKMRKLTQLADEEYLRLMGNTE
jgi:hypothetical protein